MGKRNFTLHDGLHPHPQHVTQPSGDAVELIERACACSMRERRSRTSMDRDPKTGMPWRTRHLPQVATEVKKRCNIVINLQHRRKLANRGKTVRVASDLQPR